MTYAIRSGLTKICSALISSCLLMAVAPTATAYEVEGMVTRFADGDSFKFRPNGENRIVDVRIMGIDAPESKQQYGGQAKRQLMNKIEGRNITLDVISKDKYGRLVAMVFADGTDIGMSQIEDGAAWAFVGFSNIPRDIARKYKRAEQEAREQGLGLWRDSDPFEPWEWRKLNKRKN